MLDKNFLPRSLELVSYKRMLSRYGFVNIVESFAYIPERHTSLCGCSQNVRFDQIVERQKFVFFVRETDQRLKSAVYSGLGYVVLTLRPCVKRGEWDAEVKRSLRNALARELSHIPFCA